MLKIAHMACRSSRSPSEQIVPDYNHSALTAKDLHHAYAPISKPPHRQPCSWQLPRRGPQHHVPTKGCQSGSHATPHEGGANLWLFCTPSQNAMRNTEVWASPLEIQRQTHAPDRKNVYKPWSIKSTKKMTANSNLNPFQLHWRKLCQCCGGLFAR